MGKAETAFIYTFELLSTMYEKLVYSNPTRQTLSPILRGLNPTRYGSGWTISANAAWSAYQPLPPQGRHP